jgi:protein involved in polysaccharide export with SLBB domain
VTVAGEVSIPGVYQLKPGETLEQVIQRAGGFTQNAYPYGTLFVRESTRVLQQENLDRAIRRMETDINSQAAAALQNLRDGTRGEEALQSQIGAQKALLSKIRTLKASGRIALELDPRSMKLPHVALEDGDQITIPTSQVLLAFSGPFRPKRLFCIGRISQLPTIWIGLV